MDVQELKQLVAEHSNTAEIASIIGLVERMPDGSNKCTLLALTDAGDEAILGVIKATQMTTKKSIIKLLTGLGEDAGVPIQQNLIDAIWKA